MIGATLPGAAVRRARPQPRCSPGASPTPARTRRTCSSSGVDPADPGRYLTPEGSAPFEAAGRDHHRARRGRRCTLRGARDPAWPGHLRSRAGRSGSSPGTAACWRWPGRSCRTRPDTTLAAGFALGRAHDSAELRGGGRALPRRPAEHGLRDRAGSDRHDQPGPGARSAAQRRRPHAGAGLDRRPMTGWARSRRPSCRAQLDPPSGVLVNANNRLVGDGYPLPAHRATGRRRSARAGSTRCSAHGRALDADGFAAVQLDMTSAAGRSNSCPICRPARSWAQHGTGLHRGTRGLGWRMQRGPPRAAAVRRLVSRAGCRPSTRDELGAELLPAFRGVRSGLSAPGADAQPGLVRRRRHDAGRDLRTAGGAMAFDRAMRRARAALRPATGGAGAGATPTRRCWATGPSSRAPALRDWFSRLAGRRRRTTVNVAAPQGRPARGLPFGAVHGAGYRAIYDLAAASTARAGSPPPASPATRCRRTIAT